MCFMTVGPSLTVAVVVWSRSRSCCSWLLLTLCGNGHGAVSVIFAWRFDFWRGCPLDALWQFVIPRLVTGVVENGRRTAGI